MEKLTINPNPSADLPLVVAVVLTWNDSELATNCLRSVFASDYPNLRVILVDNGSIPPRGPDLKRAFPSIELVQLADNQGFSGGANRGLEKALALSADYIHLIGNDATLAPDAISTLVDECEKRPEVGAAGPLLLDPGKEQVIQFYTATLDRACAQHFHHHVGELYERGQWPVAESEFIPCVALLFRASALRKVGLFDEIFGTCWEDFDLCLRLHDAGWKYITVGDATAEHLGSYTTGRVSPYITYYTVRNRLICLHRYSSRMIWLRKGLYLMRTFWHQIKGYGLNNWACHRAFFCGVIDFLGNINGEKLNRSKTGHIPGHLKDT